MEQLRAAIVARPHLLPLLQEAAALQACSGCCLRLAAVRDYGCSELPDSAAQLLSYLAQQHDGGSKEVISEASNTNGMAATSVVAMSGEGSKRQKLDKSDNPAVSLGQGINRCGHQPLSELVVCPLCLGLLQMVSERAGDEEGTADRTATRRHWCSFQLATTLPSLPDSNNPHAGTPAQGVAGARESDSANITSTSTDTAATEGASRAAPHQEAADAAVQAGWACSSDASSNPGASTVQQRCKAMSSLREAAAAIAAEYEAESFALEVSLPASLAVRQQSLSWRLRQRYQQQQGSKEGAHGVLQELQMAVDVKEAVKLVYTSLLATGLGKPHDPKADLRISLSASYPHAAAEGGWLAAGGGSSGGGRQRKGRYGRGQQQGRQQQQSEPPAFTDGIVQRLASMPQETFVSTCPAATAQLAPPATPATVQLQPRRRPLHVGGRYFKLRRGIPQSPWFIDGQRKGEGSVQDAIAAVVLPAFHADSYTMISAGREDIDVRMLGSGRPFILEIQNARRGMPPSEQLQRMEAAVLEMSRGGVAVRELCCASASQLTGLKEGEQEKQKCYMAVCWLPRPLTDADVALLESTRELEVLQQTPIRVLHRRANLERPKVVHEMHARRLPGQPANYFGLQLRTQAGTYIKEFVHGDLGRSRPSLGDLLGCKAQIVSLDVLEIVNFGW